MIKNCNWKEASFGSFLIAVGLIGFWTAGDLSSGNLLRMGPGWMPKALCILLGLIGLALLVRGARGEALPPEGVSWRGIFFVFAAVIFFAVAVEPLGLPVAVFGAVLLSALGDNESRILEVLGLAVFMAIATSLVFVQGLGLSVKLLPWS